MIKSKFNNLLASGKKITLAAFVMASLNAGAKEQHETDQANMVRVEAKCNKLMQDVGPILLTMGVIVGLTWAFGLGANNEAQRKIDSMKKQQNQIQR